MPIIEAFLILIVGVMIGIFVEFRRIIIQHKNDLEAKREEAVKAAEALAKVHNDLVKQISDFQTEVRMLKEEIKKQGASPAFQPKNFMQGPR